MEQGSIKLTVCQHAGESWVTGDAFVKKENYFEFDNVIKIQPEEIEKEKCLK